MYILFNKENIVFGYNIKITASVFGEERKNVQEITRCIYIYIF